MCQLYTILKLFQSESTWVPEQFFKLQINLLIDSQINKHCGIWNCMCIRIHSLCLALLRISVLCNEGAKLYISSCG